MPAALYGGFDEASVEDPSRADHGVRHGPARQRSRITASPALPPTSTRIRSPATSGTPIPPPEPPPVAGRALRASVVVSVVVWWSARRRRHRGRWGRGCRAGWGSRWAPAAGSRSGDGHLRRRVGEAEGGARGRGVGRLAAVAAEEVEKAARTGRGGVGAGVVVGVGGVGRRRRRRRHDRLRHRRARRPGRAGRAPGGRAEHQRHQPEAEQGERHRAASRRAHGAGAASAPCHSRTIAEWVAKASGGSASRAKERTSSTSGQARGVPATMAPA